MCERPDVAEIDALLGGGNSPGSVARERELPRSTVRVHWERCRDKGRRAEAPALGIALPPRLPAAATEGHPLSGVMKDRGFVYDGLKAAFDAAPAGASGSRDRAALAAGLLRAIKDQEVSLEKTLPDERTAAERLRDNPEWQAFRRILFRVLDRHPAVRDDLRVALEAVGVEMGE